ncbi:MAG: hypothetical protein AABZ13_04935 [Planctomycetota bacterium]
MAKIPPPDFCGGTNDGAAMTDDEAQHSIWTFCGVVKFVTKN